MHVKDYNVVFSIKKQKNLVEVSGYWVANGRIWEKRQTCNNIKTPSRNILMNHMLSSAY